MTATNADRKHNHSAETLVAIRETSQGTWQIVLAFGGDTENPLLCASFATLSVARAAVPGIALRYTNADRVRHRRCRLGCAGGHPVVECPRASEPLWRWQRPSDADTADAVCVACQAA